MAKTIAWITPQRLDSLDARIAKLNSFGYNIKFFESVPLLVKDLSKQNIPIILISDCGETEELKAQILKLQKFTKKYNSQQFLLLSYFNSSLIKFCTSLGFMDFVPDWISLEEWIIRICFANTAELSSMFPLEGRVSVNSHKCKVNVAAKVVWIDKSHIKLATGLTPKLNSKVVLSGEVAKKLGVNNIQITVKKVQTNYLNPKLFHLTGTWTTIKGNENLQNDIYPIKKYCRKNALHVLLAIKDENLIKQLISQAKNWDNLADLEIYTKTAQLDISKINVILMDNYFHSLPKDSDFYSLLRVNNNKTKILVFDKNIKDVESKGFQNSKVTMLPLDNSALLLNEIQQIKIEKEEIKSILYFSDINKVSFASLAVESTVKSLHSSFIEFHLPCAVSNFSLVQMKLSLFQENLGKSPWIKILGVSSSDQKEQESRIVGIILDLTSIQRKILADVLHGLAKKLLSNNVFQLTQKGMKKTAGLAKKSVTYTHNNYKKDGHSGSVKAFSSQQNNKRITTTKKTSVSHSTNLPNKIIKACTSSSFTYLLVFFAVLAIFLISITKLAPELAKNHKKSGSLFSQQLKNFKEQRNR